MDHGVEPFASDDPDASWIWWSDAGVHQNLTFPVQPDPVSGHAQLAPAGPTSRPRRPVTATAMSWSTPPRLDRAYQEWLAKAHPGPGPGGLRGPLWFARPVKPHDGVPLRAAGRRLRAAFGFPLQPGEALLPVGGEAVEPVALQLGEWARVERVVMLASLLPGRDEVRAA